MEREREREKAEVKKLSNYKDLGSRFKSEFTELLNSISENELKNAIDQTYADAEAEVEDLIDSGKVKINRDISATQVFPKMRR